MVKISQAIAAARTRWAIIVMASQMAKTEGCLNEIGRKLDDDPEPVLYIGPTQKNVSEKIEPRLMQMIDSASSLSSKLLRGKRSTKTSKRIAGVTLSLGWAGSATELASQPVAMVVIDELDRMKGIKGEGSVIELAAPRMDTYPASKGIVDSSPTEGTVETYIHPETGLEHWKPAEPEDIQSPVWQLWQEGSREEWAVPCPECEEHFIPRFKLLTWPKRCTAEEARTEARLACPRCGSLIEDRWRHWMNERGEFVGPGQRVENGQVIGKLINRTQRTFWTSGVMSPVVPFGERASDWIRAVKSKDHERIQGVLNTRFGELFQMTGDAPPEDQVLACRSEYETGAVPPGVQKIFVTVDVQQNRLPFVVRGWGYNQESWLIESGEIYGDTKTKTDKCWRQLEKLLNRQFEGIPVTAMAVDSGYNTDAVDAFALKHKDRVYATVGRDNPSKVFKPVPQVINAKGRTVKTGLKRWTLDHGHYKAWIHARVEWPQDQVGAWHLPIDATEDYAKQIVAEHRINLASGRKKWIKVSDDNHFLDCEYLQVFLADLFRVIDLPESPEPRAPATNTPAAQQSDGEEWVNLDTDNWMQR